MTQNEPARASEGYSNITSNRLHSYSRHVQADNGGKTRIKAHLGAYSLTAMSGESLVLQYGSNPYPPAKRRDAWIKNT